MFVDESLDPVGFNSLWRSDRNLAEAETQTHETRTEDAATQSVKRKNREVQTDNEDEILEIFEEDSDELANFLKKWEPIMLKALQENRRSHAFDGYDVIGDNDDLNITDISWNNRGSVIAAAYGRHDHEDWCTHHSSLVTWNLDRKGLNPDKPDMTIDLNSCIMCIDFHPAKSAWIAGGTFNGEVMVWDAGKYEQGDPLLVSSGIDEDGHREPVSQVLWVKVTDKKGVRYQLWSTSIDGKILVWNVDAHKQKLRLKKGFLLLTDALPRSMRTKVKKLDKEMGITSISYNMDHSGDFLVCSETGGVFRCSAHSRSLVTSGNIDSSVELRNPVTFTFDCHMGPVYRVEYSPFHRGIFLSCGTDGSIRFHSVLQVAPVFSYEPGAGYVYCVKWSPVRPLVFAAATESGLLFIYDLSINRNAPVQKIAVGEVPLYNVEFNAKDPRLLATGDARGHSIIWRLPEDLCRTQQREVDTLAELAGVT